MGLNGYPMDICRRVRLPATTGTERLDTAFESRVSAVSEFSHWMGNNIKMSSYDIRVAVCSFVKLHYLIVGNYSSFYRHHKN